MRRARLVLALLPAVVALGIAGCGGEEEATPTPETVVGTIPTETSGSNEELPALDLTGDAAAGADIWTANGCGGCHTLAAANSTGNIGPNLDDVQPSYELAVTRVTLGQGQMPAFGDQLDPQQIADVSQYVVESSSGG
jgi:mono/diheme cytochrome c family protein